MLEIKNVHKSFGALEVLKGIDLQVDQGDVVSILGPSGSGKTTLLRCINFLERADGGEMVFDGETYQMDRAVKKRSPPFGRRRPSCSRTTTCSSTRPPSKM